MFLLVTADESLRDEIALTAAVVGARTEVLDAWPVGWQHDVGAQARWAAALCTPETAATAGEPPEGLLLVGRGDAEHWQAAAGMPTATPVPLPAAEDWLGEHLASRASDRLPGRVVAVAGAHGSVGTSTTAFLLAAEASARGGRVLLVDADLAPGSGLRGLVVEESAEPEALGWGSIAATEGALAPGHLSAALPEVDGTRVLTGPPGRLSAGAIDRVLAAGRRGFDLVVVDVGRDPSAAGPPRDDGEAVGEPARGSSPWDAGLLVCSLSAQGLRGAGELLAARPQVPWSMVVSGAARPGWCREDLAELGMPLVADLAEQRWLRRAETLAESYEVLRTRRGEAFAAALLHAVGAAEPLGPAAAGLGEVSDG